MTASTDPVRLNLGAGGVPIQGWENLDRKTGDEIFPLGRQPASVDVIRASHVLEHFPHESIQSVVNDWVASLKPGGLLQIAVPDFELIARAYLAGAEIPVQGYVMGGQVDSDDFHRAIFDREVLTDVLRDAGLVRVSDWTSEIQDCAALPISLNLQARKPPARLPRTAATLSLPRLQFSDNAHCAFQSLPPLGIPLRKYTGAYWEQCLTRAIEETIAESHPEWILTLDYDTVFSRHDVLSLLSIADAHPEADAIAALQASRTKDTPLLTVGDDSGVTRTEIGRNELNCELLLCKTAHFGLTLLRAEKLLAMRRPWFMSVPDGAGSWGPGRKDADVYFWHQWAAAGNTLFTAARVPVGHAELMVRWPDQNMEPTYQHPSEFWRTGKPEDVWR